MRSETYCLSILLESTSLFLHISEQEHISRHRWILTKTAHFTSNSSNCSPRAMACSANTDSGPEYTAAYTKTIDLRMLSMATLFTWSTFRCKKGIPCHISWKRHRTKACLRGREFIRLGFFRVSTAHLGLNHSANRQNQPDKLLLSKVTSLVASTSSLTGAIMHTVRTRNRKLHLLCNVVSATGEGHTGTICFDVSLPGKAVMQRLCHQREKQFEQIPKHTNVISGHLC